MYGIIIGKSKKVKIINSSDEKEIEGKHIIIATGAKPKEIPNLKEELVKKVIEHYDNVIGLHNEKGDIEIEEPLDSHNRGLMVGVAIGLIIIIGFAGLYVDRYGSCPSPPRCDNRNNRRVLPVSEP